MLDQFGSPDGGENDVSKYNTDKSSCAPATWCSSWGTGAVRYW